MALPSHPVVFSDRRRTRAQLRRARRLLSDRAQRQASRLVQRQLACDRHFQQARHIGLYLATDGEVDLSRLLESSLKQLYLPLLSDALKPWEPTRLLFQPGSDRLATNRYGIQEPVFNPRACITPYLLDLVLMPLVAFDRKGHRLGMGKGYYDRTFPSKPQRCHRPRLLGVAHSLQEVEALPQNRWDVAMDGVVTERELIWWR